MDSSAQRRANRKRTNNSNNDNCQPPKQARHGHGGAGNQEVFTIKKSLSKLVVSMLLPLETVEDSVLCEFVKACRPLVEIPPKPVIRSLLLSDYRVKKTHLKSTLESAEDLVLTCESWSHRAQEPFLSVSVHFVDNHGNLRSYALSTVCLFGDVSVVNVQNRLGAVMKDWGLEGKVHSVVRAGLPQLKGKWRDVPCFADTLDVIFNDLMREEELAGVFGKCRNIVRFFKFDPEAEEKLRGIQRDLNRRQGELSLSGGDRWFLWLELLEALMEQDDTVGMALIQESQKDLILDGQETVKVKNIISALKPLRNAAAQIKPKGFQSVSVVLPLLKTFMDELKDEEQSGNRVAKMLLLKSKKEFGNISKHPMAVFTFLDPRYKNLVERENRSEALNKIKMELAAVAPAQQPTPTRSARPAAARLDDLLGRYMAYEPTSTESNPFSWWRNTGKQKFGGLNRIALKKLGVVSTAVPLDRAFSGAGGKFCHQRNAIEPENLDMILFLNTNSSLGP